MARLASGQGSYVSARPGTWVTLGSQGPRSADNTPIPERCAAAALRRGAGAQRGALP